MTPNRTARPSTSASNSEDSLPARSSLRLKSNVSTPLYRQIYERFRTGILLGQFPGGAKLPSTRALATQLGVARNRVVEAFDQLTAEGYVEGRKGSGVYVSVHLPDRLLAAEQTNGRGKPSPPNNGCLSEWGRRAMAAPQMPRTHRRLLFPFQADHGAFPHKTWARLVTRRARRLSWDFFHYSGYLGYRPLREAIASYLGASRGVRCTADQVVITNGSQQALHFAAQLLLNAGDSVWMEEPGYPGAYAALAATGARLVPITVDDQGLVVSDGLSRCRAARMAFVTPSHQFPLGVTMSLARRLELLKWADEHSAWILEDDYDSELRYTTRPIASLQGLNMHGRVLYVGTFSKMLCASMRIGYLVVPQTLVPALAAARWVTGIQSPTLEQAAACDFIEEGHFDRHLRRMRTLYAERQRMLLRAARRELGEMITIEATDAGMHTLAWLPAGEDDASWVAWLARRDLALFGLSSFCQRKPHRGALLLGFSSVPTAEIAPRMRRLAAALHARPKDCTMRAGSMRVAHD